MSANRNSSFRHFRVPTVQSSGLQASHVVKPSQPGTGSTVLFTTRCGAACQYMLSVLGYATAACCDQEDTQLF